MLVAELHRLLDERIRAGDEVRSLDRQDDCAQAKQHKDDRNDAGFRPGVSTFWEYLRHAIQQPLGLVVMAKLARFVGRVLPKTAHFISFLSGRESCEKFLKRLYVAEASGDKCDKFGRKYK
jgi:hypothetical protein